MDGFILKCKKCGREVELKDKRFYNKQWDEDYDGEAILGVNWYQQIVEIKCECGNEIWDD